MYYHVYTVYIYIYVCICSYILCFVTPPSARNFSKIICVARDRLRVFPYSQWFQSAEARFFGSFWCNSSNIFQQMLGNPTGPDLKTCSFARLYAYALLKTCLCKSIHICTQALLYTSHLGMIPLANHDSQ